MTSLNFEEALTHELNLIPALSGKVYPMSVPGKSAPYAQYESSYGQQDKDLQGYQESKAVGCEINLLAASYASLKSVMDDVMPVLCGFEQRVIGVGGPYIQELTYDEPVETYEPATKLNRCIISFKVHF